MSLFCARTMHIPIPKMTNPATDKAIRVFIMLAWYSDPVPDVLNDQKAD